MNRLRHWCSSRSLQISPLHREFHSPLPSSSLAVSGAVPRLSHGISHPTYQTAYLPFTPSDSEQRLPPPYHRGCWHGVSRGFLSRYRQISRVLVRRLSSLVTAVYDPKAFIPHAASHGQACAHCQRSSTAASRRSLGSISIPVWLTTLSSQLPVKCLGRP